MKKVLVVAVVAMACGGAKPVPGGGGSSEQAPQWLRQGTGMFNTEAGKRIQGVGAVTGMRDVKTRRMASDSKAREQLAQTMDGFYQALGKMSESNKENVGADIANIGKKAVAQAAEIRDHWVTSEGTESAFEALDLAAFKQAVQRVDGDELLKREIANNADRAFDQLAK
jgi:hypothetical protein